MEAFGVPNKSKSEEGRATEKNDQGIIEPLGSQAGFRENSGDIYLNTVMMKCMENEGESHPCGQRVQKWNSPGASGEGYP